MKKPILIVLICLMAAISSAIIVETASLKNFLTGSEPNCQYDNWLSHMAEGIAIADYNLYAPYDIQTTGFGDFKMPDATDLLYWNSMLDYFTAGDYDGAQAVLTSYNSPFQIVEFHDTDTGRTYYIIREIPNMSYYDDNDTMDTYDDEVGAFVNGWGIFIYNPVGTKPAIITIPHSCDDFPAPMMGYMALNKWNAKYLMINGAGREVRWTNEGTYTNSKSYSDPTRYALHPFHIAYKKFADKVRDEFSWREFSAQLHAYDWNRHVGYANCQISAGNPRMCPNLPIRDLSNLKHDLINNGENLMIPANTVGIHRDVYLNDFYGVNYNVHDFTFTDGVNTYPVNPYIDLPAYTQNLQMIYTQGGTTDYDVYEPFFHMEMDELPNSYDETENNYKWFYGWNEQTQRWDMNNLFTHFVDYYGRWIDDMEVTLEEVFIMNDGNTPATPTNLAVLNQSLTNVTLSWTRSSDYDFDSYEVLYATEPIGLGNYQVFNRDNAAYLASQAAESIVVPNLDNSAQYWFRIRAKDKNGNISGLSNEVNTILAPASVTSLTAHGLDDSVRVYWQVGAQTNNQGFKVYRKRGSGPYYMVDSWQTNPALSNSTAFTFEWWDTAVDNDTEYTYKISSTNLNNIEFFYNYPASANPQAIHTISIRNNSGTLTDFISFGTNPYASDGNDAYWDTTKANPSAPYVWNAFWEQYWGSSGTQLSREIKADYYPGDVLKTWTMRVGSDQLETLFISASDNFTRSEKLYLLDGGNGTYANLLSGPYQYTNANTNIRSMTLFWGNMQPKVLLATMPNKVFQGGSSLNLFWNYQYPFLIDHVVFSVVNATDSLLVNSWVPNNQFSYSYFIPQNILEMQNCRVVADLYAVDGVHTRFWSNYNFSIVPYMNMAFNNGGWKTRSNPWLNSDLSFEQVFGAGSVGYYSGFNGDWTPTTDYNFGTAYWVNSPDMYFYSNTNPVQTDEYNFDLITGWNFVPNPHFCAYNLEDISFTINANLFTFGEMLSQHYISRAVYVFREGEYKAVTRIEPFESFFIKFYGNGDQVAQIRFYPFFNGPAVEPPVPDWELSLKATQLGLSSYLQLGMHPLATDNCDFNLDLPKAPTPPFPLARMWFTVAVTDTAALEHQISSDFRTGFTQPEQIKTWDFNINAASIDPVTFSFEQMGIPAGWQILITLNGEPFYLGSAETWTWTPPAAGAYAGTIRVSNFEVGVDDLIQSPLTALTAYPNPFNPDVTISFNIAAGSNVQVDIFNIRGQKVASILDDTVSAGHHTLKWEGKDFANRSVSSGIYFARVHTKNKTQIIKMMLMK